MGLLDKLWDDVVAGPQPEKGLGKLRHKQGGSPEGTLLQSLPSPLHTSVVS